ncbi:MAG: N-acetyltransferase [Bacteroidota bacterium]
MNSISTIPLTEEDRLYCFQLAAENMKTYFEQYRVIWDRQKFFDNIGEGRAALIYYHGERAGFYHWRIKSGSGYVSTIQIEEQFRGKGIGKHVLSLMEFLTKQEGLDAISLSVYPSNPAMRLYQSLGYRVINTRNDAYLMTKQL